MENLNWANMCRSVSFSQDYPILPRKLQKKRNVIDAARLLQHSQDMENANQWSFEYL